MPLSWVVSFHILPLTRLMIGKCWHYQTSLKQIPNQISSTGRDHDSGLLTVVLPSWQEFQEDFLLKSDIPFLYKRCDITILSYFCSNCPWSALNTLTSLIRDQLSGIDLFNPWFYFTPFDHSTRDISPPPVNPPPPKKKPIVTCIVHYYEVKNDHTV